MEERKRRIKRTNNQLYVYGNTAHKLNEVPQKEERQGRTYTSVTPLDIEGRKRELARIIGGANITETTLKSAEEMLRS